MTAGKEQSAAVTNAALKAVLFHLMDGGDLIKTSCNNYNVRHTQTHTHTPRGKHTHPITVFLLHGMPWPDS